jgi:hypothetical protein
MTRLFLNKKAAYNSKKKCSLGPRDRSPLSCRSRPQLAVGKKWQYLLKVVTVTCTMYISCIMYIVYCILYSVYIIPYTYCIQIELYTFSTYIRMASPRVEKQQHIRLHALQGQEYHHLMLLSYAGMLLIIPPSRAIWFSRGKTHLVKDIRCDSKCLRFTATLKFS